MGVSALSGAVVPITVNGNQGVCTGLYETENHHDHRHQGGGTTHFVFIFIVFRFVFHCFLPLFSFYPLSTCVCRVCRT